MQLIKEQLTKEQQQLTEMFHLQNTLQEQLSINWRDMPWDHDQAIIVECSELMTELGYKWWKNHTPNYDNVRIELIDIWHFMLNKYIVLTIADDMIGMLPSFLESASKDISFDDVEACRQVKEFLTGGLTCGVYSLRSFLTLCANYGLPFKEIYWLYMFKNTLNIFRWRNGYKDGTYVKMWNGVEDNMVLMELTKQNPEMPFKDLYKTLEQHYEKHVKPRIVVPPTH